MTCDQEYSTTLLGDSEILSIKHSPASHISDEHAAGGFNAQGFGKPALHGRSDAHDTVFQAASHVADAVDQPRDQQAAELSSPMAL